jgi:hypothetical protein
MKSVLCDVFGVILLCGLCGLLGCKSKHEAFFDEMLVLDNELMDLLDTVTDDFSAEQARPKLDKLMERYKEHVPKIKTLGEQSPEEWERLGKKYEEPLKKLADRMKVNMPKLRRYNLGGVPVGANPLLRPPSGPKS